MTDLTPHQQAAATALENANTIALKLTDFRVTSAASAQYAADVLTELVHRRKALETERDSVAKPLRAAARKISDWFKRPIEQYAQIETHMRNQIKAHNDQQAAQARAALVEAKTSEEITAAVAVVAPKPQGVHFRDHWSARVTDPDKLPREFWAINQSMLDALARAQKEDFSVPGCEVVRDRRVVTR